MTTNEDQPPTVKEKTPLMSGGNYQPIHLEDTVGAIFLGIFALIALIGWVRAENRYQKLINQREIPDGNHSIQA